MCAWGHNLPRREGSNPFPPGKKFFTVCIFRKNTSKFAKVMFEPYTRDILNQFYRFFSFLRRKFWNSFRQKIVWKTTCWFLSYIYDYTFLILKSSSLFLNKVVIICTQYMHRKKGKCCQINFIFSRLIIYIIFLIYRRKYCDGHIILLLFCRYFSYDNILEVHVFLCFW